jgi:hypothetical protein
MGVGSGVFILVGIGVTVLVGDSVGTMVNVGVGVADDACPHAEKITEDSIQITICNFRFLPLFMSSSFLCKERANYDLNSQFRLTS